MHAQISNLKSRVRRVCFVTGTRAEFGLMASTLRAIQSHRALELQLLVTGMHLDPRHGRTIDQVRAEGWQVNAMIPWPGARSDLTKLARHTGQATARMAKAFDQLRSDIVLLVGDRVEAFAAAAAAHLSGRVVAHVHGGDRALGQVDDALRHAITKFAHLHFPATTDSARRILKLGEDPWRVHTVGSPGLDGVRDHALPWSAHKPITSATAKRRYALLLLHPTYPDESLEYRRAKSLLRATRAAGFTEIHCVWPNNDPGAPGIIRCWNDHQNHITATHESLPRPAFLGLLRDAAVLAGNSSSGIIEAASFGTPVLDIGDRQQGRLRGQNVSTVPFRQSAIQAALQKIPNHGRPRRVSSKNPYTQGDTGPRIAKILATTPLNDRLRRKLIAY